VLTGITPDMRIYSEESFGPLVTVVPFDGPDAAVEEFSELRWITVQSLPRHYPI
jgi:acyl-CoA reductase-like NAD-dependent aldehyde dehydrogenase